jgi:hypothetical protein
MIRVTDGTGLRVAVEIWSVPRAGLAAILLKEKPGLTVRGCRRPFQLAHGGVLRGVRDCHPRQSASELVWKQPNTLLT